MIPLYVGLTLASVPIIYGTYLELKNRRGQRQGTMNTFSVDVLTCSFCSWTSNGRDSNAIKRWEEHMSNEHSEYWQKRNAIVDMIANTGSYDTGHGEGPTLACGRLAYMALSALGLTPNKE